MLNDIIQRDLMPITFHAGWKIAYIIISIIAAIIIIIGAIVFVLIRRKKTVS